MHLLIVADGPLQSVPFGVLLSEPPGADAGPPRFLIRHYAITVLPSVSSLRALRAFTEKNDGAREPFAGFGDPVLQGRPGDTQLASLLQGAIGDSNTPRALNPLPDSGVALRGLARVLGSPDDVLWLRERATETEAKRADLARYRVLAFATHGLLAGRFGDFGEPALVLTPPPVGSEGDDGLLAASEIAQLKLNADWVILPACNTTSMDGTPSADGLPALAKAFLYAGARALLVSHWPTAPGSLERLTLAAILAFAKEPRIGRAEALRRSMLAAADDPKYAHPQFWAPLMLVGEGGAGR